MEFEDASDSTKQNRMAALAKEKAVAELLGAAQKRARSDGDADLAAIIKRMRLNRWDDG